MSLPPSGFRVASILEGKIMESKKANDTEKKLIIQAMGKPSSSLFTDEDIDKTRSIMIEGNYPASISDCEVVGISGWCGKTCSVFQRGHCDSIEEGIESGSWTKEEAHEIGYDVFISE